MISTKHQALIDSALTRALERHFVEPKLKEAVSYSLLSGGKRVRPQLAIVICEDLGGKAEDIVDAACAIEILHAASLIHDDLPALDNDDMRRGKPSCHKRFGEATALLAADLMVALAFSSLAASPVRDNLKNGMTLMLSEAFMDLCSGQQLDLDQSEERAEIKRIHELKTGALFAAAAGFGALGSGGNETILQKAKELGMLIGLGFQIVDDYLDVFGTEAETGRATSSDARNNKPTFFNRGRPKAAFELLLETQRRAHSELLILGSSHPRGQANCNQTAALIDAIFSRARQSCSSC